MDLDTSSAKERQSDFGSSWGKDMTTYEVVCSTLEGLKPPNPVKSPDLRPSLKVIQGTNEHLK